jgi:hypothetical protein
MWRRAWRAWTKIAHRIGNFQARVLLTIFYFVLVLPFGIAVRLFGDPLRFKHLPNQWLDHPNDSYDLEWAKKQ